MKKKILVTLNHSLYVRGFLSSGLLDRLVKEYPDFELEVFVDTQSFKLLSKQHKFSLRPVPKFMGGGWLVTQIRWYLREICMASRRHLNSTYEMKLKVRVNEGIQSFLGFHLLFALNRFFDIERAALWVEENVIRPNRKARKFMEELNPDLVFFVSVIHDQMNILDLLKAAKERGIPILTYVASWDNLTSKGPFLMRPDKLLVWGEIDREMGVAEHGFSPNQFYPVGAPHFDPYIQEDPAYNRESFLRERGLDPQRKTIFFVGTTKHKSANEPEILRILIEETKRKGSPIEGAQIWYRPHPRMLHDESRNVRNLPGIFFDDQSLRQQDAQQHGYSVHQEDIMHTARVLRSIDVIASAFSTMIIEAALIGKPSVMIRFAQGSSGQIDDVIGTSRYKHLNEIGSWDFIEVANDITECAEKLGKLIATPPEVCAPRLIEQATFIANNPKASAQGEIIRLIAAQLEGRI